MRKTKKGSLSPHIISKNGSMNPSSFLPFCKVNDKELGEKIDGFSIPVCHNFDLKQINGEVISDPQIISNEFCNYFVKHPKNVRESVPSSNNDFSHLIPNNPNLSSFVPCTESEIDRIVMALKKEGSLDDISRRFLQKANFVTNKQIVIVSTIELNADCIYFNFIISHTLLHNTCREDFIKAVIQKTGQN